MVTRFFVFTLLIAGLSACAQINYQRSPASGYGSSDNTGSTAQEYFAQRSDEQWNFARRELGIPAGQPLTPAEKKAIQARVQLRRLEKAIPTEEARKQYYALKPYFTDDSERIYFLQLPTRRAREQWAQKEGISTNDTKVTQTDANLIKNNNISLGMTQNEVKQSWGEPSTVEYAGDPIYQNERWSYKKQVSTDNGYKDETRIVYFESGRVAGWETM